MSIHLDQILQPSQTGAGVDWNIPEHFNIAEACVGQHAQSSRADSPAFIIEDEILGTTELSYAELNQKALKLAEQLDSIGVGRGDRVLIRLPNSAEYPISFFACLYAGAIAVPTSTLLAADEVAYLGKDAGAKVLITHQSMWSELGEALKDTPIETTLLVGCEENAADSPITLLDFAHVLERATGSFEVVDTKADEAAYLVYTSGTTGFPKGVLHAHRALLGRLPASTHWFDFSVGDQQDRIMHSGKFNWTYVLGTALMDPLLHGNTVIVYEGRNNPDTWPELIKKHACSIFIGVPTIYRQIIQRTDFSGNDLPSLRHCMSAGEHLSDEMQQAWEQRFGKPIYEAIGMSEISYYISQNKAREVRPGAAGFPQPGHGVALLDGQNNPVAVGEEGMIAIPESDPGLFLEYWQLPEQTREARHDGWFFTGDYARQDQDGYIWFLGRRDDIINTFGYRVSPHEIERVVKTHPQVADCVAIGEEVGPEKILVSVCVIAASEQPDTDLEQSILDYASARLAKYKAPKIVHIMNDFPRTKNGKVIRQQLATQIRQKQSS